MTDYTAAFGGDKNKARKWARSLARKRQNESDAERMVTARWHIRRAQIRLRHRRRGM